MLKMLEVDGALEREGGRYLRTLAPWEYPSERVARVTAARRAEQAAMREYLETPKCLMEYLREQLDDPGAEPCGRCMNCTGVMPDASVDPDVVRAAQEFLRGRPLVIVERKQWPRGLGSAAAVSGRIPLELRAEEGRVLSFWGDGGWGMRVREGVARGELTPEVVEADAALIDRWPFPEGPTWVAWVPTARRADIGAGVGAAVAERLGIPALDVVRTVRETKPQSEMENSAQQVRNVLGAFAIDASRVRPGPVLLIDDVVDSGWTLTVVAAALREAGSGPVYPFALARKTGR